MSSLDALLSFREISVSLLLLAAIIFTCYKIAQLDSFTKDNKYLFIAFVVSKLIITLVTTLYIFKFSSDGKLYRKLSQKLLTTIHNDSPSFLKSLFNFSEHLENSVILFTHILSLEYLLLFDSYVATNLLVSFVTIICAWRLFKVFKTQFPLHSEWSFYPILFTPAFVLWTSTSHLKEAYMYSCIVIIIYAIYTIPYRFKLLKILAMILCGYFILVTRKFLFLILILSVIGTYYFVQFNNFKQNKISIFISTICIVMLAAIGFNSKKANKFFRNAAHRKSFSTSITKKHNGALIESTYQIKKTTAELYNLPRHIATATLRPWIWESTNKKTIIVKLESFILLLSFLCFMYYLFQIKYKNIHFNPLITFSILFSLGLLFTIGLSSANYGAISRYRSIAIPFLLTALWTMIQSVRKSKNLSSV